MINKVLGQVGRVAAALSPIDLFNADQIRKLGSSTQGFRNFSTGFGDLVSGNMTAMKQTLNKYGDNAQLMGISDYMSGFKTGENRLNLSDATKSFRAKVRKRAAAAAGIYAGSSLLFGSDSFVPSTARAGATLGMHGGIAAGLSKFAHPMAGAAYAGLGLFNMNRAGDNWGPM